jgi:hypothetical protein
LLSLSYCVGDPKLEARPRPRRRFRVWANCLAKGTDEAYLVSTEPRQSATRHGLESEDVVSDQQQNRRDPFRPPTVDVRGRVGEGGGGLGTNNWPIS